MVWYGMVRYGTVRYRTVAGHGMVRYGTVRCGTVWYGTLRCKFHLRSDCSRSSNGVIFGCRALIPVCALKRCVLLLSPFVHILQNTLWCCEISLQTIDIVTEGYTAMMCTCTMTIRCQRKECTFNIPNCSWLQTTSVRVSTIGSRGLTVIPSSQI